MSPIDFVRRIEFVRLIKFQVSTNGAVRLRSSAPLFLSLQKLSLYKNVVSTKVVVLLKKIPPRRRR
jgi:hypothetical protein